MSKKKLFGTSGIRGEFGSFVDSNLALNLAKAIGTYLNGKGKVVIGYDSRTTNKTIENAIAAGLSESGCDVIKLGLVPTGLTGFATEKLNADCGVMITASHNPSIDNGIKLWNKNGMAFTSNQESEIEKIYFSKNFIKSSWDHIGEIYYEEEVKEDYINTLLSLVNIKTPFKVVIDSASGAGSFFSPLIFRKAGCEVITLNSQLDGHFPGRKPEPNEANLGDLMEVVKATGANLGIAHDGDADRMISVDEKGYVSDFDKLLAVICKKAALENGGKIITTVDAGLSIDDAVGNFGEVLRSKVGDVNVAELMLKEKASFGGEPSGTWIHPEFSMCPDGILSGLKIAEIVSNNGSLYKILEDIKIYPNERVKIKCTTEEKLQIMDEVENKLADDFNDIKEVNSLDGVRLTFNDGSWVLVRPSGTQDYIRITLEGINQNRADEIKIKSENFLNNYLNS